MSKNSEAVKRWRRNTKVRIVQSLGGRCVCCGYCRYSEALDAHHLDPATKEFGISVKMVHPVAWDKLISELRKCVLLCANCHREVGAGHRKVPKSAARFDEQFVKYRSRAEKKCLVCGGMMPAIKGTCSVACRSRTQWSLNWDTINLKKLLVGKNFSQVARELGVSDVTVRKRSLAGSSVGRAGGC